MKDQLNNIEGWATEIQSYIIDIENSLSEIKLLAANIENETYIEEE